MFAVIYLLSKNVSHLFVCASETRVEKNVFMENLKI